MKRHMVLALVLVCVLCLSGCGGSAADEQITPSNSADETSAPAEVAEATVLDTSEIDSVITDIAEPNLSMSTMKDLAERFGEELTWVHFAPYYSEDIGSGLHILRYPIDSDYCLMIGGSMEESPMHIYLVSEHDSDSYIDIRSDSIDDFLSSTYT